MPATCWEVLVRTGFESRWCRISVPVLVAYVAMLDLWLDLSAIGWGDDCTQFKLSRKPGVDGLNCGEWQYNKRNFTYFTSILLHTTMFTETSYCDIVLRGSACQCAYFPRILILSPLDRIYRFSLCYNAKYTIICCIALWLLCILYYVPHCNR